MAHSAPLQGFFLHLFLLLLFPIFLWLVVLYVFGLSRLSFWCVASAFIGVPASGKKKEKI